MSLKNSKKNFLKKIMKKKNNGFSLVEMLIIIGLISGLSLIVMNITKQTTKSSTKYQFDSEIMLITNEINGILSDPHKCLTTFTNATQLASPSTPVLNATPANVINPGGIAGIPSAARKYTITGGPYGNGGVMIANYSLDLSASPDGLLTINFQNKTILGSGTVSKTIRLYVERTIPGIITLCRSVSTSSDNIWSHGTGTTIHYPDNVGIGTATPGAKLEVAGGIKPGNATIGTSCSPNPEGTLAYDMVAHSPVFCNNSGNWTAI